MKLELESLEYDRKETGMWTAVFSVRDDEGRELLRFSEGISGSSEGHQYHGWKQMFDAPTAMDRLFKAARKRLKEAADAT